MRILLINLPRESEIQDIITPAYLADFMKYPPLGLLAIAAEIDPRHSVKVLDTIAKGMSIQDTVRYILGYRPDVLGISAVTRYLYALDEISRKVKEAAARIQIVVGGPHVDSFPYE